MLLTAAEKNNDNYMKKLVIIFIVLSVSNCSLYSQNKTIKGRVITDQFETMSFVSIMINDTVEVGRTDLNGFFQIDIPVSVKKILFRSVGLEPAILERLHRLRAGRDANRQFVVGHPHGWQHGLRRLWPGRLLGHGQDHGQ